MARNVPATRAESGGPSRVWAAILSRADLKRKEDDTWRVIPLEPGSEDIEAFHQVYSDHSIPQASVKDAFPDHWAALHWYMSEFQTSLRWPIEAWLMTGMDSVEVAKKIDPSCPTLAVDIYRRAFFHVTDAEVKNPGWMFRYIWGPGMAHRSSRYYFDFFLKAVAFYKGVTVLEQVLSGDALDPETSEILRNLARGLRDRLMLTDINISNTLSSSERAPLVENAFSVWRTESPPPPQSNPILDQLAATVKQQVGVMLPGSDTQGVYEFSSEKYEDADETNEQN